MGLFEKLPYTNFHRVNLNWIIKKLQIMDAKLDEIVSDHDAVVDLQSRMTTAEGNITSLSGRMTTAETKLGKIPLPAAGDVGKVLGAVADGAGAKLSYVTDQTGGDVPTPAAGDNGKVLTAGSGGTYSWETAPTGNDVPTPGSGDNGKVLTAGSGGSYSWDTVPTGNDVPTPGSGDTGKVLTAGSGGTYSWQTAGGGSGLSLVAYRELHTLAGDAQGGVLDFDNNSVDLTAAQQQTLRSEMLAAYAQGAGPFYEYVNTHIIAYAGGKRMMYRGDASTPNPSGVAMSTEFLWYVNVNNTLTQVILRPSFEIEFTGNTFIGFQDKNCLLPGTSTSITPTDITGATPYMVFTIAIYM